MAEWTVLNSSLVAFTLTDEVQRNLHFFCEAQRLYLNGFGLAIFWTALRSHTDAECDLWIYNIIRVFRHNRCLSHQVQTALDHI